MAKRQCEVCGARVTNQNPLTTTCDSICVRARNNNLNRYEQIILDIEKGDYGEVNYPTQDTEEEEGTTL